MRRRRLLGLALATAAAGQPAAAANDSAIDAALRTILLDDDDAVAQASAEALAKLGDRGAVAPLIHMFYWTQPERHAPIAAALARLTGVDHGASWFDWMLWLQDNPGDVAYAGYIRLFADLLAGLDQNFARFIHPDMTLRLRIEEIVWGGVAVDGIPALDRPRIVAADMAGDINPQDTVFGAAIGGEARAYPLRILAWHEMANDVLGGRAVSLAFCTLCGAAILFDTLVAGREAPFTFGSSGLLWRSNKLMYDRATDSLWNQFTGRPVAGQLADSGIALAVLPLVTTTWEAWRRQHPHSTVLSLDTGFVRDYAPGVAYRRYFASPDLLFPARTDDRRLAAKDKVFGLRAPGGAKAWPLARFAGGAVVNDQVGLIDVVLVGDAEREEVRAFAAEGRRFTAEGPGLLRAGDGVWRIGEAALQGPDGRSLPRLPGHVAYWFAWAGYFPEAAPASAPAARP